MPVYSPPRRERNRTESKRDHISASNRKTERYLQRSTADAGHGSRAPRTYTPAPPPISPRELAHDSTTDIGWATPSVPPKEEPAFAAPIPPTPAPIPPPIETRKPVTLSGNVVQVGELAIDLDQHVATVNGIHVHLTGREQEFLESLARRNGQTVSKRTVISDLYGDDRKTVGKALDVFLNKIRKKFSDASGGKNYIRTVRGIGFRLVDPALEQAAE